MIPMQSENITYRYGIVMQPSLFLTIKDTSIPLAHIRFNSVLVHFCDPMGQNLLNSHLHGQVLVDNRICVFLQRHFLTKKNFHSYDKSERMMQASNDDSASIADLSKQHMDENEK